MIIAALAVQLVLAVAVTAPQASDTADRSRWELREPRSAIARARELLGLPDRGASPMSADLVTLDEDNTPFLNDQLVGRPLWKVAAPNWSLTGVAPLPPRVKDRYVRTVDALLDPRTGQLLKVKTRWPAGEPPIAPEPGAGWAAEQMYSGIMETYHGFPMEPPNVSFTEAVMIVQMKCSSLGPPVLSKQIVARYVLWSEWGRDPRPVWVITLRGIPLYETNHPKYRGVHPDAINHFRWIVDPIGKSCVTGSNSPQPERFRPKADKPDPKAAEGKDESR